MWTSSALIQIESALVQILIIISYSNAQV